VGELGAAGSSLPVEAADVVEHDPGVPLLYIGSLTGWNHGFGSVLAREVVSVKVQRRVQAEVV